MGAGLGEGETSDAADPVGTARDDRGLSVNPEEVKGREGGCRRRSWHVDHRSEHPVTLIGFLGILALTDGVA